MQNEALISLGIANLRCVFLMLLTALPSTLGSFHSKAIIQPDLYYHYTKCHHLFQQIGKH